MTSIGHEARTKAVLDNLRRRSSHTVHDRSMPPEAAELMAILAEEIKTLKARLARQESFTEAVSGALMRDKS